MGNSMTKKWQKQQKKWLAAKFSTNDHETMTFETHVLSRVLRWHYTHSKHDLFTTLVIINNCLPKRKNIMKSLFCVILLFYVLSSESWTEVPYQVQSLRLQRHPGTVILSMPLHRSKRQGVPQRLCNMFGCDCSPPPRAKCCRGYLFDKRSRTCRERV